MKVLFVTDEYVIDPLGIGYLSSYAKQAGHEIDLIQFRKEFLDLKIADFQPDILAYSVTTGRHNFYKSVNDDIQQRYPTQVVWGGPHITFFPKFIKGDDIGIRGEAYEAFPELLNRLEVGQSLNDMRNLALEGLITPLRPLYDKTFLLHPDRELIYKYDSNRNNPIKNVMCSHFCPYSCGYCYNVKYKEMYHLRGSNIREVPDVIDEIKELQTYPLNLIFMQDDIFPIYKDEWLDEFCNYYSKIKVPFHIQIRVEMINDERIRKLKEVGLHGATFAVESGNQKLRHDVLGRNMTDETIIKGANILHKYGIRLRTENMIGVPHETLENTMETLELNIKCRPDIAWASLFQPYPGTELHKKCLDENLFD
ncbi:MAG: B12-binding domain-containing radical SAM protein, partial [Gammaproteobacteria bacterium]|nr:B12-binding domain-containing radical SAM protein [Gammaproteobacteria bacterium]